MPGCFQKSEGANIGLGIQKSFAKGKSLNKYSSEFIDKYTGDTTFKGAGSLPMSGTIKRFVKDNFVLVGDAAGMVLPSNGAGNNYCHGWQNSRTNYRRAHIEWHPTNEL